MIVSFLETDKTPELTFVVVAARHDDKWLFVRHRKRSTYEHAGGHIEPGESSISAARRELFEEAGAIDFELVPVCKYGVTQDGKTTYGEIFYADVIALGEMPTEFEMAERILCETFPENLTYPEILPKIHARVRMWLDERIVRE